MGARTYLEAAEAGEPDAFVIASGGRRWGEAVEADAMAEALVAGGVPGRAVVRERCSLDTIDNARFSAAILERRGIREAAVVTCSWHLPRALALFADAGVQAVPVAARDGETPPWASRVWRWSKERVLTRVSLARASGAAAARIRSA